MISMRVLLMGVFACIFLQGCVQTDAPGCHGWGVWTTKQRACDEAVGDLKIRARECCEYLKWGGCPEDWQAQLDAWDCGHLDNGSEDTCQDTSACIKATQNAECIDAWAAVRTHTPMCPVVW